VRKVPGFRNRALHRLLTLFDQRVQVVNERLDLRHVAPFDPRIASTMHVGQAGTKL